MSKSAEPTSPRKAIRATWRPWQIWTSNIGSARRRRGKGDGAGGGARDLGLGAGDLDVAQRLPAIDEVPRPRREHVARLAERDGEAAVVEVGEVVDRAVARAVHRL